MYKTSYAQPSKEKKFNVDPSQKILIVNKNEFYVITALEDVPKNPLKNQSKGSDCWRQSQIQCPWCHERASKKVIEASDRVLVGKGH